MNRRLLEIWGHLPTFVAVARAGSVTGAADRLGLSPSAVSKAVKLMEERLEATVFVRKSRGVSLTEAGRALLAAAEHAVSHMNRGLVAAGLDPLHATVRVSFMGTLDRLLTAPMAGAFREEQPGLRLSVSNVSSPSQALADVEDGSTDLTYTINVSTGAPFAADFVGTMPMAVYIGRHCPLFGAEDIDLEALLSLPFVARSRLEGMKSIWPRHLKRDVRLEVDSHALALEACLEAGFAMVMSRYAGQTWVEQGKLRELQADYLEPARVEQVCLESRRDEPVLALLLQKSRAVARSWETACAG